MTKIIFRIFLSYLKIVTTNTTDNKHSGTKKNQA